MMILIQEIHFISFIKGSKKVMYCPMNTIECIIIGNQKDFLFDAYLYLASGINPHKRYPDEHYGRVFLKSIC